jgi:hypothetical protein
MITSLISAYKEKPGWIAPAGFLYSGYLEAQIFSSENLKIGG